MICIKDENNEMDNKRRVDLAFPMYEQAGDDNRYISKKGKDEELIMYLSANINDIPDWFKQYQVESIELWINGLSKLAGNTIGSECKGEGGLRVVLKPRT